MLSHITLTACTETAHILVRYFIAYLVVNVVLLSLLMDPRDEEDPTLHRPLRAGLVSPACSDVRVGDAFISVLMPIATAIIVETATFTASCSLFHLRDSLVVKEAVKYGNLWRRFQ